MPGWFYGTFEGRRARINAEKERASRESALAGFDVGIDEIIDSTADPATASAWNDQFNSYKQMAMSDNADMQRAGMQALTQMGTEVRAALETRRKDQLGFVVKAADDQRERYTVAQQKQRDIAASFAEGHALLADPDFDPNTPLNRGQLMTVLKAGPRQLLSDPEDFADALGAAGGSGLVGGLIGILSGTLAAEDFDFSKEDWRRVYQAAYLYNSRPFLEETQRIAASAQDLEKTFSALGGAPPGYSLTKYVMEQQQDFANPIGAPNSYPEFTGGGGMNPEPGGVRSWLNDQATTRRRTQMGPPAPEELSSPQTPGILDFEGYFKSYRDDGARILVDPGTGSTWAQYDNGRKVQIDLPWAARQLVKRRAAK